MLSGGGPCPMLADCNQLKRQCPCGCSEELPPFLVSLCHPGKLLQRRKLSLPTVRSWEPGTRQQDLEKKPSTR